MRVLFIGDLAATGFGTVTTDLGRGLLERGVDVRFLSQNDFEVLPEPFHSRTLDVALLASGGAVVHEGNIDWGVDQVRTFIPDLLSGNVGGIKLDNGEPWGDWKAEAVLLLGDFAAARIFTRPYIEQLAQVPTFHYVPVEGIDLPPMWANLWRIIKPIAMSRFGQIEIAKILGEIPPLAYHGVSKDFWPVSPSQPIIIEEEKQRYVLNSKAACKNFFGMDPRRVVCFRADRNMPRKRYGAWIRIAGKVLARHDEVDFAIHATAFDQGGFLYDSISKLPERLGKRIQVSDRRGLKREVLNALYNAADIYVSTSAEGFGLTIAEAMACGVPAVGMDYSSVPEVIGAGGILVPPAFLYDNEYDHYWAQPDEDSFADAVSYLVEHPTRRRALGYEGAKHVKSLFTWERCAEAFEGVLATALGEGLDERHFAEEVNEYVFEPLKKPEPSLV